MKYRDAIIKYFFHHNVSSRTKKRVFRYLANEQMLAEKDDTMQKIWDDTRHAILHDDELGIALMQVENNLSLVSGNATKAAGIVMRPRWRIFAASWLIAVMAMSFSAYWYIQTSQKAEQVDQVEFLEAMTDYGQKKSLFCQMAARYGSMQALHLFIQQHLYKKRARYFCRARATLKLPKEVAPLW